MDRSALQRLSTEQLMHLILVIIHIVCSRLNITLDPTAVYFHSSFHLNHTIRLTFLTSKHLFQMPDSFGDSDSDTGSSLSTRKGYAKGGGKTQNGSVLQQLPLPSTQSNASSSSYGPMQTLLPNSITTGSHNNLSTRNLFPGGNPHVPDQSNWFVSSIPEDAPAARPATSTSALTDDDLFDEPDWVPPIHVQIPADWPPLPDISSS